MLRIFVSPEAVNDGMVTITGEDVHHMKQVLRMKEGEEFRVSDGENDFYCILREFCEDSILGQVCYQEKGETELPVRIHLFQGLPKGDKMELILQKAVELGAYEIIPVSMKRCVVKLDAKKAVAKQKRWQEIAKSAAKQSKRIIIPEVSSVMSFKDALAYAKDYDLKLLPYENEKGMEETRRLVKSAKDCKDLAIFIGPEGGFDDSEVELARSEGWKTISLGKRILRTETAGLAMLSMLVYELDD
ncbi:Ribosomal RNA small subunit methyltransferase E [Lachnospiraceae bacterium TWA4]|nr:Ribosomal RNA small subunit methyltransferase E [Lachnospiraceae bacterium TWA4]